MHRGLAARVVACVALVAVLSAGGLRTAVAAPAPSSIDDKVEALLRQMTLEEKVGQMTLFSSDWSVTGPTMRTAYISDIQKGRVGAVFNALTPDFTRKLQRHAVEETRLKIPLIFGYDVIHGHRTIFPIPVAEACSWDLGLMERSARIAAVEASADGLQWTFAPMVDIARDPRWGRISEGAGEDPWLGSQVAAARTRGFQGQKLSDPDAVLACVKHYAAYGAAQAGRDYNTVDMSRRELLDMYLPPYQAAVKAGCATVMTAFNELDGTPCSANEFLLSEMLRKKWGFKGFVVTDYTSINEMINHGSCSDLRDAARQAALAGVDMDMQGAAYLEHLVGLVKGGQVSEAAVDDAVRRILRLKFELGLFDNPYRNCDNARKAAVTMSAEHLRAARDAARRSIVLLRNQGNVLPLRKSGVTIALVGPLASSRKDMLGSWAAAGDGNKCVSVADGIALKSKAVKVLTAKGCDVDGTDTSGFAAAVEAARKADVVVAVMGEDMEMSGEAASRSNIALPGVQRQLLEALKATGKPVVLVLMNGRPLAIPWEAEHVDAIVEAWFLGTQAGAGVADVLFGDYNPSGRLVTTFPRSVGQVPLPYNVKNTGRPISPKDKYTSKYLDLPNTPLYPFGYGLSYTTFTYSPLRLSSRTMGPGEPLTIQVTVTNTGDVDGEEVAQLYVRDLVGSVTRPVRELKGFQKVFIARGQSKVLTFSLSARDLAFHRKDMTYGAEAGDFRVWVGPNAASGSEASFRLSESVTVPE